MLVSVSDQRVHFLPVCVLSSPPGLERSKSHLGKCSENNTARGNIVSLEFLFSLVHLAWLNERFFSKEESFQ